MDNYNYPAGSDSSDAPWNEEELPQKEVEVVITMTICKTLKVYAPYLPEEYTDETGDHHTTERFQTSDLKDAVNSQVELPGIKDDWEIDDLTVELA